MKPAWRMDDVARLCGGQVMSGDPKTELGPIVFDSRAVEPGVTFLALKGHRQDGHDFVSEAVARGASAVIVSRECPLPSWPGVCVRVSDSLSALQALGAAHRDRLGLRVIGVTGSNGKTTTKEMVSHVLTRAGNSVFSSKGNLNSQLGLPLMLLEMDDSHEYGVLEMGASQRGEIARLASLAKPQVGVITNAGLAHLEFFGSAEGVAEAKWELAAALPATGAAVINADDPALAARARGLKCSVIRYGTAAGADVRAENIRPGPETVFDLTVGFFRQEVRLSTPGRFNVYNALAAVAVGMWEKVDMKTLVRALETFSPPPSRMEVRTRRDGAVFVLDAYNANPSSMKASLESFVSAYPSRRKIAVLGGMKELGAFMEKEHEALGALLAALSLDEVFFLGEEADWVRRGFERGKGAAAFRGFGNKEALHAGLRGRLSGGTAVLFKASRSVALENIYGPLLTEK
ncbi:MAG TPA: UDP-N-acetylmuramoyl-tripeptide--D-alanyl-D-alanine ligase [Elusimicrobiota bacterium]|nr:UDP-N-acetylmuramoyl-tripeptide--D-alanyl-D-alanine ligase [Elusimicrobiota bacterium]